MRIIISVSEVQILLSSYLMLIIYNNINNINNNNILEKINMVIELINYLALAIILFVLGICGTFLNRKNIIIMLMSIELILLSVNLNFIIFSIYIDDVIGQLFALFILTVAAAESAIGLAILVVLYHVRGTIAVQFLNIIKG